MGKIFALSILGKMCSFPPAPAMKNLETGHLFLNDEDEQPDSRVLIENAVIWEYSNTDEEESIRTTGPLKYGALLMV